MLEKLDQVALLTEGVDRNVIGVLCVRHNHSSPSSRRAWIEIIAVHRIWRSAYVALLTEGVDRNTHIDVRETKYRKVALLTEGVDRNFSNAGEELRRQVALLTEGVDRNVVFCIR